MAEKIWPIGVKRVQHIVRQYGIAELRSRLAVALLENRRLRRELDMATGVLNQVDAYEHVRALDAWRAQRERLAHGIDIAALFPAED